MFYVVYVPASDIGASDLHNLLKGTNTPDKWLREEEGHEDFQTAWEKVSEINAREKQITCLVFSDVTNNVHFPEGLLSNYPYNETEE